MTAGRWALALGLLTACSRSFSAPGGESALAVSVACGADGDCQSGSCVDGVCCDGRCDKTESCNLAGSTGHCTPRPFGATCDAGASCPQGFCVDGVCCDAACPGNCENCALVGQEGHCAAASDGTDPRGLCGYTCTACYGGSCGAAPLDSNPEGRCDGGLVCGVGQSCALPRGSACDAGSDCSTGVCLINVCTGMSTESVTSFEFNPAAEDRYVLASALDGSGAAAVVMSELDLGGEFCDQPQSGLRSDFTEDRVFVLERSPDRSWRVDPVFDSQEQDCGEVASAAVYAGDALYVALYNEVAFTDFGACVPGVVPCGVFVRIRGPDQLVVNEPVDDAVEGTAAISLAGVPDGRLAIAYDGVLADGSRHVYFRIRTPGAGWSPAQDLGAIDDASSQRLAPLIPRTSFGMIWSGDRADVVSVSAPLPDGGNALVLWDSDAGSQFLPGPASDPDVGCQGNLIGPLALGGGSSGFAFAVGCSGSDPLWLAQFRSDGTPNLETAFGVSEFPEGIFYPLSAVPVASPDGIGYVIVAQTDSEADQVGFRVGFFDANGQATDLAVELVDGDDISLESSNTASDGHGGAVVAWIRVDDDVDHNRTLGPVEVLLLQR